MYYLVKYNESLIDVSLKLYGSVSYVFDLIKWNNTINISTPLTGKELYYEPVIVSAFKPIETAEPLPLKNVTIKDFQSIFDLSLQIFGSVENVFDVIKLSKVDNICETETAGLTFNYNYLALKVPKYINDKELTIATKYPYTDPSYRIINTGEIRKINASENRIVK